MFRNSTVYDVNLTFIRKDLFENRLFTIIFYITKRNLQHNALKVSIP